MEYKNPYLGFIVLIPLLLWIFDFLKIFKVRQIFIPATQIKINTIKNFFRFILFFVGVISFLLIGYSLSGPRKAQKFSPSNVEVNDIFLVLDVSRSMLADDFSPNRLEVAKQKVREFVRLKPLDRLGLIVFSEKVFTLMPLTTDVDLIAKAIDQIQIGGLGSGTNIGDGLALAVARLINSEAKNKVIVLLTDGVNNVGNITPLQAAEMAKENKIKVYTIAMGTDNDARIPVGGGLFGTQFQPIPGGSIDTKSLEQISQMTSGRMFSAKTSSALESVFYEIERLEKTKINVQSHVVYDELFLNYILLGSVLLILTEILRKIILREVV